MADPIQRLTTALSDRYRLERPLGEGGMATVHLAEDLKHDRKVAIKVLKPELAAVLGAERFVAEIKTTAALQHPNILPLFDSGSTDGFLYYVMPYVEGETLRDKLDREQQLGIDEAVKLTTEVADALQYAHDHGVVHRDIKPENILIHAGRPMVADFGIALAVSAAAGGRMTETGLSLGTPHYMSPEQATAERTITGRSDIYSLAAVLYEMLTGDPPHVGKTAQQIIAKIVTGPPIPVTELRKSVPPNVAAALGKALEKLPADRFAGAKAFAEALTNPSFRTEAARAAEPLSAVPPYRRPALLTTALALTAALAIWGWLRPRPPHNLPPSREVRFTVPVGADSGVYLGGVVNTAEGRPATSAIALSPDGTLLVYAGWKRGTDGKVTSQLYRRPLNRDRAEAIAGTDGASCPFFSPDGKWIAFFAGPSLKRVPATGGNVETIALDAHLPGGGQLPPWGASWGDDNAIFYSTQAQIYRIPAGGGEPTLVLSASTDTSVGDSSGAVGGYGQPMPLPGGRTLLFQRRVAAAPRQDEIVALALPSGEQTTLLTDATDPIYVPPGRVLFMRRGTLMEVGLDPAPPRVEGQPRAVLQNVMQASYMPTEDWDDNAGQVAVSRTGDLAYVPGGMYPEVPLTVERIAPGGHVTPLGWEPRQYVSLRLSPIGTRVAFEAGHGGDGGIYVRDLTTGATLRLNTGGFTSELPVWSPDGKWIAFQNDTTDRTVMYRMAPDNSGPPELLAPSPQSESPSSWSTRGILAFIRFNKSGIPQIWTLPPGGTPTPFVATRAPALYATFSPDGDDLAYVSLLSGRPEVYVRPYPGPGAAVPVSNVNGVAPAWSRNGRHLYYVKLPSGAPPMQMNGGTRATMMVADVISHQPFRVGRARALITSWPFAGTNLTREYDPLPDGSFLTAEQREPLRQLYRVSDVHVILNFLSQPRGTGGGDGHG